MDCRCSGKIPVEVVLESPVPAEEVKIHVEVSRWECLAGLFSYQILPIYRYGIVYVEVSENYRHGLKSTMNTIANETTKYRGSSIPSIYFLELTTCKKHVVAFAPLAFAF